MLQEKDDLKNVTIIIPHYNSPKLLRILLDSITHKEGIQILVIDDKSTLNLENYHALKNDPRYHHVEFLENETEQKGAGVSRNIGLQHAVGRWILFADADDYFTDDWYVMMEPYLSMDYDVVFFELTSIFLDSGQEAGRHLVFKKRMDQYRQNPNKANELTLRYMMFGPWGKLIRRKFIEVNEIIFDHVPVANDVMFSTQIGYYMREFTLASTIPFYCITRSKGTLTTLKNQELFSVQIEVFFTQISYLKMRLPSEDFEQLDWSGSKYIKMAIRYGLGIRVILRTYITLRKNHIRVWRSEWWNPICFLKSLRNFYHYHKEDKKYLMKK